MRLSDECVCGANIHVQGFRRHAQFMWATWRQGHIDCRKPEAVEDEPERHGSHADTQLGFGRSQDGRWVGGWDHFPPVEMKGEPGGANSKIGFY